MPCCDMWHRHAPPPCSIDMNSSASTRIMRSFNVLLAPTVGEMRRVIDAAPMDERARVRSITTTW
jgi:hypothetical protein